MSCCYFEAVWPAAAAADGSISRSLCMHGFAEGSGCSEQRGRAAWQSWLQCSTAIAFPPLLLLLNVPLPPDSPDPMCMHTAGACRRQLPRGAGRAPALCGRRCVLRWLTRSPTSTGSWRCWRPSWQCRSPCQVRLQLPLAQLAAACDPAETVGTADECYAACRLGMASFQVTACELAGSKLLLRLHKMENAGLLCRAWEQCC